jgi:hypothetical protein
MSMGEEFNLLIKSYATRTVPAAETKSIGLQHLRPARRDEGVQGRPTCLQAGAPTPKTIS